MFVCLCRAVSDHTIAAAVEGGARTLADVSAECGAGTVCGTCLPMVQQILLDVIGVRDGRA